MGRMDNFVLFYRAVFGFVPEQLWEIPDPYGLIRSRTMVSPECSVRLPLNMSESRQTATGRFVTTFAGAGVHHIALATGDIVATLERLLARGARMLPIPPTTTRISPRSGAWTISEIALLRRLDLLYDRDEKGEFLHAYTDTFDDRFFFEMVERRGDYQQYGAANAAVRIAAQAQRRPATRLSGLLA